MRRSEISTVVEEVGTLVENQYLDAGVGAQVARVLRAALAEDRYPTDERELAVAVTRDLQSVNGDKHLRLLYHEEPLAERKAGDDSAEYAAMSRWAEQTSGGVAQVRRLPGNIGHLDLQPIIFPAAICGEAVTAALSLLAATEAIIVDLRHCLGGEPAMVAFIVSYLWDHEPVQLTGLCERGGAYKQAWTQAYVPGRRFGRTKPVYVLTSNTTFSGGEGLAYDLQQLGRATIVGERTRGGAHAREGFRVHPHLQATISVARSVNPVSGTNWEGDGVTADIETTATDAYHTAYRLALEHVISQDGPAAAEARTELAGRATGPSKRYS
jgi:hypothetical protein